MDQGQPIATANPCATNPEKVSENPYLIFREYVQVERLSEPDLHIGGTEVKSLKFHWPPIAIAWPQVRTGSRRASVVFAMAAETMPNEGSDPH